MRALPTPLYFSFLLIMVACSGRNHLESQAIATKTYEMPMGNCEDCELMFAGIPDQINSVDTSDGWFENGQKLIIKGKALHHKDKRPAKDVIIYYYHTNQKGYYDAGANKGPGSVRHGRLRGWVKTGDDGSYTIFTSRPAQYPSNNAEAHIHVIVKEPDINQPYWIDPWVFDDDPLLTPSLRNRLQNRGGSGIMKTELKGGIQLANQDIILGLNIPQYPGKE